MYQAYLVVQRTIAIPKLTEGAVETAGMEMFAEMNHYRYWFQS